MEKVKAAFDPNKDATLGKKENKQDGPKHETQIENSIAGGTTSADVADKEPTDEGPHGSTSKTSAANQQLQESADPARDS